MKKFCRWIALLLGCALMPFAAVAEDAANGIVVDATMNTVAVETAPGQRVALSTGGADLSGLADGLLLGAPVTLRYAGALDGGAKLIALSDCELGEVRCAGEVEVEGTKEAVSLAAFVSGDGVLLWYDAERFSAVEDADEGVCVIPLDADAAEQAGLQLNVMDADHPATALQALRGPLEGEGYAVEAADVAGFPETCSGGWICAGNGEEMQVYTFGAGEGAPVYCAMAFYPADVAEGWGPRMRAVISTLEIL